MSDEWSRATHAMQGADEIVQLRHRAEQAETALRRAVGALEYAERMLGRIGYRITNGGPDDRETALRALQTLADSVGTDPVLIAEIGKVKQARGGASLPDPQPTCTCNESGDALSGLLSDGDPDCPVHGADPKREGDG